MANGHVRCGSCATVFSAYSGLREDLLAESLQGDELLSPTMQSQELAGIEDLAGPDDVAPWSPDIDTTDEEDAAAEPLAFGAADEPESDAAGAQPATDAQADEGTSDAHADSPEALAFDAAVDDWAEVLSEIQASADDDAQDDTPLALEDAPSAKTTPDDFDGLEAVVLDRWELEDAASTTGADAAHDDAVGVDAGPIPDMAADEAPAQMAATDVDADDDADWSISEEEIDATLAADPDVELLAAIESRQIEPPVRTRASKLWGVGSVVLLGLIAAQVVHHFRAPLAGRNLIGPLVQETYGFLGLEVQPEWDLAQYEILNWSAKAGAAIAAGIGNLQITAQIRNNGPRAQPFPRIHLELKDRWEATVGSRVFGPRDYLPADIDPNGLMPVGTTVPADLAIVDPGADASGFELDVCLEIESGGLRCSADRVFQ